jgi:hypothetical protein
MDAGAEGEMVAGAGPVDDEALGVVDEDSQKLTWRYLGARIAWGCGDLREKGAVVSYAVPFALL